MKKLFLSIALLSSVLGFSQTIIYQENFESGNSFTMNTSDLGGSTTYNTWLMNNSYTGASGTFICLGFPFSFVVNNTPAQPVGITGFPNSNYMHITAQSAVSSGITSACYIPADGTCVTNESNFTKMTTPISTLGLGNVTFDFYFMCAGSNDAFGELYYSLNGGATWILKQSNISNVPNWSQTAISDAAWDNQSSLMFAFRFVNNIAVSAADPGFCIDEITVFASCTTTSSTMTVNACDSYLWIDGNTYTTSNNVATDTLTNVGGCDSVVTLNLTINQSTTGTDVHVACDSYTWPLNSVTYTSSTTTPTFTLTNAAGCDSVVTLNLTINTVDVGVTNTSPTLTANASGATYQWLDCANNFAIISGETSQSFTAVANGNYAVAVTQNGCTDTSACVALNNVGITENGFDYSLSVYPNPTTSVVNIDLGGSYAEALIIVRNALGQELMKQSFYNAQLPQINIAGTTGVYFVEVIAGDKNAVIKVLKEEE